MKFERNTINDDGMAGIVSPVETDHVIWFASKEISDFPFAFVAPLGANDSGDLRLLWGLVKGVAGWPLVSGKKHEI